MSKKRLNLIISQELYDKIESKRIKEYPKDKTLTDLVKRLFGEYLEDKKDG